MAQWGPFLAVTILVLVILLVLARKSQTVIHDHAPEDGGQPVFDPAELDGTEDAGGADTGEGSEDPGESDLQTDVAHGSPKRPAGHDDSDQGSSGTEGASPAGEPPSDERGEAPNAGTQQERQTSTTAVDNAESPATRDRSSASRGTGDTVGEPFERSTAQAEPTGVTEASTAHSTNQPQQEETVTRSSAGTTPSGEREIVLTPGMLLGNVAVTQGIIAAIIVVAAWYFSIPGAAFGITETAMSTGLVGVGVGIGFGLALWLANEFATTVADAVGASYDEAVREMLAPETTKGWVVLFAVVLPLIAISEELLFRAALIGVPAAGFDVSVWLLAVLSSIAFALGHGAQGRVGIIVTGVLGLVLAAGFILTESLLVVIVAHYVINAMEFLVHEFFEIESLM